MLLHPETAHCGGPNFSSTIRSMVYFRLKSTELFDVCQQSDQNLEGGEGTVESAPNSSSIRTMASDGYLSDMWIDFKGLNSK